MNSTKKNIRKTSGIHERWKFYKPGQLITVDGNVAIGSPKPPKGNRITDGTQNSSIGEKQSYTSK